MESSIPSPSQAESEEQDNAQNSSSLEEPSKDSESKGVARSDETPTELVTQKESIEDDSPKTDVIDEGFVVIETDEVEKDFRFEANRISFFRQIEDYLVKQIEKCDYFKDLFEKQNNSTMASKFAAYSVSTGKNLEILRASIKNGSRLPKYRFDLLSFNCIPTNVDVKEKELQIVVKTSQLDKDKPIAEYYIIAEFSFPRPADTFGELINRWLHHVKIEPKNIIPCSGEKSKQLDIVYSTSSVPFTDPDSKSKEFDRPISFHIDKGRSRTLKRKFKLVKLTFYERRGFLRLDRKVGSVQIRIDSINDHATVVTRLPILNNRKPINAEADIKVRVREPLVDKTIRICEEKMLVLS